MIKGLIFDLDGTLLDSVQDLGDSINAMLEEYGYPIRTYDEIQSFTGNGFRKLVERSLPIQASKEFIDEATLKFMKHYDNFYVRKSKAYEGIMELLKELNRRDIKIAINTNKGQKYASNIMNKVFKDISFIDCIGKRSEVPHKPDPTAIRMIQKQMNLNDDELAYVGDSEVDIETGKNGNVKTIACTWGFRDIDVLKDANPDVIVNKPIEILRYIEEK